MAHPDERPANPGDLISRVSQWLTGEGFPFEMEVAAQFGDRGLLVTQSLYYSDPISTRSREIDVVAQWESLLKSSKNRVTVTIAVECKNTEAKPWVLLISTPPIQTSRAGWRYSRNLTNSRGRILLNNLRLVQDVSPLGFITGPTATAHGCVSAFRKDGIDPAYEATMVAAKAAQSLRARAGDTPSVMSAVMGYSDIGWFIPLVVIHGKLLSASINAQRQIGLQEITWGRVLQRNPDSGSSETLIDVVTRDGLPAYLESLTYDLRKICDAVEAHPDIAAVDNLALTKQLDGLRRDSTSP